MRKKILFVLLLVFSLFFVGSNVDAETNCKKKDELKAEASAVEVNYELIKEKDVNGQDPNIYYYDIIITNVSDNFEIQIGDERYLSSIVKNKTLKLRKVGGGYKFRIGIYASKKTGCEDTKLRTIPVELPHYNRFSDYEECAGHTNEYPICSPTANVSKYSTDEEFEKEYQRQVEEYKNKNKKNGKNNNNSKKKNILELYMDNSSVTVPVTILIVIAVAGFVYKVISDDKKKTKIDLGVKKHEKKNK